MVRSVMCAVLALQLVFAGAACAHETSVAFGFMVGGKVVTNVRSPSSGWSAADIRSGSVEKVELDRDHKGVVAFSSPARWRIEGPRLWCTEAAGFGTALQSVSMGRAEWRITKEPFAPNVLGECCKPRRGVEGRQTIAGKDATGGVSSAPWPHSELRPLADAALRSRITGHQPSHDIGVLSECETELFLLVDNRLSLWTCEFEPAVDLAGGIPWNEHWKMRESIAVEFTGDFYAHRRGSDLYVVTESGKVYQRSKENAGFKKSGGTQSGEQGRVLALLIDARSQRAFAFGRAWFCELTGDPRAVVCTDVTQASGESGEPLRILSECAKALVAAKVVDPH